MRAGRSHGFTEHGCLGPERAGAQIRTTPCDEAAHNHPGMAFHRFSTDAEPYNRVAGRVMSDAGVPVIDLHTFTKNLRG